MKLILKVNYKIQYRFILLPLAMVIFRIAGKTKKSC